jgi:hypothetical protein
MFVPINRLTMRHHRAVLDELRQKRRMVSFPV